MVIASICISIIFAFKHEEKVEPEAVSIPAEKVEQAPITLIEMPSPQYTYYTVTRVVDGDTLKVSINGKEETLRLIGIDTPETVDPRKPVQCFGKEASERAKELLSGQRVRIETDSTQGERDKYGRLLAYVYREDGLFYNKVMIEEGYAHEYTYDMPYTYQAEFRLAQKSAEASGTGLWSPDTCSGNTKTAIPVSTESVGKVYTSSYGGSKYYYPELCTAWKDLDAKYVQLYDNAEELLKVYPSKIKSPKC